MNFLVPPVPLEAINRLGKQNSSSAPGIQGFPEKLTNRYIPIEKEIYNEELA